MNLNQQIECWIKKSKNKTTYETRPFVTLAYAQGLDGSITTRQGKALGLSGKESKQLTHQLRGLHDGILVGIETVLADDPQLTVREWEGENPQPIILDSQLRLPDTARVCNHPDKPCWVLTVSKEPTVVNENIKIILINGDKNQKVPLNTAMQELKSMGISSLMVEGGATVITAFLKARIVDSIIITITPWLIGGYKAVADLDELSLSELPALKSINHGQLGNDLIIYGDVIYGN